MKIELNKVCWYFELKAGVIVLAYIEIFINILAIIACTIELIQPDVNEDLYYSLLHKNLFESIVLGLASIFLVEAVLLIVGVLKQNRLYFVPYLLTTGIFIIINLSGMVYSEFLSLSFEEFLENILSIALYSYFWLCVYSLYYKFKRQENSSVEYETIALRTIHNSSSSPDNKPPPYSDVFLV